MDSESAFRFFPAIPGEFLARIASEPFGLLVFALLTALILQVVLRMVRDPRSVRRALEADGLHIKRMQLRYFTRGPFAEMRSLPGFQFSDRLYRVEAIDRGLQSTIVWVRLFNRSLHRPLKWELRTDEHPERTSRGIGLPAFTLLLTALLAAFLTVWVTLARQVGLLPVPGG